MLACHYSHICSGCSHIYSADGGSSSRLESVARALSDLSISHPPIKAVHIADCGLRDRVDLQLRREDWTDGNQKSSQRMSIGLFDQTRKTLVDLQGCPQMSPELESWYREFRRLLPNVEKGSVRLRVSPSGNRGVWLDLANLDIKNLLSQTVWLESLTQLATVEMGQRRKMVCPTSFKLLDPVPKPWFETYSWPELRPIALLTLVGGFTQPGFRANRMLVKTLLEEFRELPAGSRILELGCGSGNFTLAMASAGFYVTACEIETSALDCLQQTLTTESGSKYQDHVELTPLNFHKSLSMEILKQHFDAIMVDPPRSGLGASLTQISELGAKWIFYVSCYPESFAQDCKGLPMYEISKITLVDQFPQSDHSELVAVLRRRC